MFFNVFNSNPDLDLDMDTNHYFAALPASNANTVLRAQRFPAAVQKANLNGYQNTFDMHVLRALAKAEGTLRK